MNDQDHDAVVFNSSIGVAQQVGMENPLWVGNSSTDMSDLALDGAEHALRSGSCTSSYANGMHFSASQFPVADGALQNGDFVQTANPAMRPAPANDPQNYPRQEDGSNIQQTAMMNAYIEKFSPACPPYAVGSGMGYYPGGGPIRRGPSVLPEIDLSHRPGSLQEAICMYIDFLMAENEIRTRISECAVASPPPPLDFHREEYYRDVMCRPVNFPTARFRDWLKHYNVDIEITDPDGQTVSQTTFAPATPVSGSSEARSGADGTAGWQYSDGVAMVPRRRQRSSAIRSGVICHGGGGGFSPRPVQLGPAGLGHPLLQLQAESAGIPVEMFGPTPEGPPQQGTVNFTPPLTVTGPAGSSLYQAQSLPAPDRCAPSVNGCGYGSLPAEEEKYDEEEEEEEEDEEEMKEELATSVMPASGWPLERPEFRMTNSTVECPSIEAGTSDQPLTGSSADPYFHEAGTTAGREGHFDSKCFASVEAAAADQHWTTGVIRSPVSNRRITDIDPTQLDHDDPGNFAETSPDHARAPVMDVNNRGTFPVVIEPTSPSGSCISTGSSAAVVQEYAKCFATSGSAGCQLPCEAGSDQELYRTSRDAQLSDAAAPETGTSTPPSHSTDTTSCLDLGSDFEDLLGTRHSDEFDYHLNYGNSISSSLPSKELTEDVPREPRRSRARQKRSLQPMTTRTARPSGKVSRRESADH